MEQHTLVLNKILLSSFYCLQLTVEVCASSSSVISWSVLELFPCMSISHQGSNISCRCWSQD